MKVDIAHHDLQHLIQRYRQEKTLAAEELALLPNFLLFHNLFTFTRLLRALENVQKDDLRDLLKVLREKLDRKATIYRDRFCSLSPL
ncbi:MAG: hypothetical protein ACRCV9_09250 [Burkholderiaceae bacterium]